jgi:hypothetical protein
VLARPVPVQPLEAIPRRHGKFPEFHDPVELGQLPPDRGPHVDRAGATCAPAVDTIEQVFRRGIREGPYHGVHYNGDRRKTGLPLRERPVRGVSRRWPDEFFAAIVGFMRVK